MYNNIISSLIMKIESKVLPYSVFLKGKTTTKKSKLNNFSPFDNSCRKTNRAQNNWAIFIFKKNILSRHTKKTLFNKFSE